MLEAKIKKENVNVLVKDSDIEHSIKGFVILVRKDWKLLPEKDFYQALQVRPSRLVFIV